MSLQDQALLSEQHALIDRIRKDAIEYISFSNGHIPDPLARESNLAKCRDMLAVADLAELGMACRWTLNNGMIFPARN